MSVPPEREAVPSELQSSTLWRLEFADGGICVAEVDEEPYLVLFTSPERAREFAEGSLPAEASPVKAVPFSENEGEFMQAAQWAAGEGICGAFVDPDQEGGVATTIEFSAPEEESDAT